MLKSDAKMLKPTYKLCKVCKVYPDEHGIVRTVRVLSRPRDVREPSLPYSPKQLVGQDVPIQRLVLILPLDQQKDVPSHDAVADKDTVQVNSIDLDQVCKWPMILSDTQFYNWRDLK